MRTYDFATRKGAGILLRDPLTRKAWKVSDWSPATRTVYGHTDGSGKYEKLPSHGLELVK